MTNNLKRISIGYKKQDAWVGVYWDSKYIYVCLIPFLPIKIKRKLDEVSRKCPYCHDYGSYNADAVVVCVSCDKCGDHCQCDEEDF